MKVYDFISKIGNVPAMMEVVVTDVNGDPIPGIGSVVGIAPDYAQKAACIQVETSIEKESEPDKNPNSDDE